MRVTGRWLRVTRWAAMPAAAVILLAIGMAPAGAAGRRRGPWPGQFAAIAARYPKL
jgi:hypothetical protein